MSNNKKHTFWSRLASNCTQFRVAILLVTIIVTAIFSYGAMGLKNDLILRDMFPNSHPYMALHERFADVFGSGASSVVICMKVKDGDIFNSPTLHKIKKITEDIELWDEVYRSLTKSIASKSSIVVNALGGGVVSIESLMWPQVPSTKEELNRIKKNIFTSPAFNGTLVSKDGTATLIFLEFRENISYERVHQLLRNLADEYTDDKTQMYIVGFPALAGWIYHARDNVKMVFLLSIVILLTFLAIEGKRISAMVPPLSVGLISAAVGLGFAGFAGINFSPLLYVAGFLIGARKVSHSLQVAHRFREEYFKNGCDKIKACKETIEAMVLPNLIGVLTDAAGFCVLLLSEILLLQQIALIMTVWMLGIGFAAILTPVICVYLPIKETEAKVCEIKKIGWLAKATVSITRFSIGRGKYTIGVCVLLLLIFASMNMMKLKIGDPNPGTPLFWGDHKYNKDQDFINRTFNASSENYMLFYDGEEGSVYDTEVLNTFEAFARHMRKELPDIYKSSSTFNDLLKTVNYFLNDGDRAFYQVPRNKRLFLGVTGYAKSNTDHSYISQFVDNDMKYAQATLYFADHTSDNLHRISKAASDFFTKYPMKVKNGEFKLAGGRVGLEMAVNQEMVQSHAKIDFMVLVSIFVLCVLSFRSMTAGLMLTLPLLIGNTLAYAYMALNNIGLSINTLPVAAIGVGVGVDFSIYIYSRVIEEYSNKKDWHSAIMAAVLTSGKTVVITGLAMIMVLIPWYIFSELKFQAQMGFFLSMLLGTNVLVALTVHPLLIFLIKPKFISRGVEKDVQLVNQEFISGDVEKAVQ